jgi:hypothetical protein
MTRILCCFKFGNERMAMEPQNAPTTVSIDSGNHDGIRRPRPGVALEKHYSVAELAKLWELSERNDPAHIQQRTRSTTADARRVQIQERIFNSPGTGERRPAGSPSASEYCLTHQLREQLGVG